MCAFSFTVEKSVFHNAHAFQAKQIIDGGFLLAGTINLGELPRNQYPSFVLQTCRLFFSGY